MTVLLQQSTFRQFADRSVWVSNALADCVPADTHAFTAVTDNVT